MLHGFTQSGPNFRAKTRALEKALQKAFPAGITLSYPTAPIQLAPADIPFPTAAPEAGGDAEAGETDAWAWWRRKDTGEPYVYEGLELGFERIAQTLREEGPFDGVIGFSQGGAMTGMLAAALEEGRVKAFEKHRANGGIEFPASLRAGEGEQLVHKPFKFAASYSGFIAKGVDAYQAFYEPKIQTPMLHFIGTLDTVVEESRSMALVESCENSEGRIVYHPGGHFLTTQKTYVAALVGFIKDVLHKAEGGEQKEESVEDMDVPF